MAAGLCMDLDLGTNGEWEKNRIERDIEKRRERQLRQKKVVDKRGSERWREKEERTLKGRQRLKGMETMDGNEKEKKGEWFGQ